MKFLSFALCLFGLWSCTGCSGDSSDDGAQGNSPASSTTIGDSQVQFSGTGCQFVSNGFGPQGNVNVRAERVVSGLEVPWGIAFLPSGNWLVTERPGRVRLVRGTTLVPQPVAQITVGEQGEGGLLGIAVHPDFSSNRFFYVYYTADVSGSTVNRVARYRLSQDETSAQLDRMVLDNIPAGTLHDGGRIHFGPDGLLYVGTGDARDPNNAQNQNSLAGKILRVTPDGGVPPDNPFSGLADYITGVRNTQGFDWLNAATMIITDHGPSGELGRSGADEVSIAGAGANLGWPTVYRCESQPGMVTPIISWEEALPPGGAAIYTGSKIPEWNGSLMIGALGSKHLQRVVLDVSGETISAGQHEVYFQGDPPNGFGRLRDVVMGSDGELYVTTSNCDGRGNCPSDKDAIIRITR